MLARELSQARSDRDHRGATGYRRGELRAARGGSPGLPGQLREDPARAGLPGDDDRLRWGRRGRAGARLRRDCRPLRRRLQKPRLMDRVPLFDLRLREVDIEAVATTLRSGWLTMGPRTRAFEEAFAEMV